MKKVISLCLVMAILATMFAVSFTALSVSDEGSVSAKTAIAATGAGDYDDFVGDSTKLYFDAKSTGWDMSGTNKIGFFAFPLSDEVADNYKSWGGKRLQGTDKDGDGIWEYDASVFKLEEGVQYKIIFAHVINNAFSSQTYDLFFDTTCLGHVAYCTGQMYENPVDSSKKTLAAFWAGKDDSEYGPVLQISSIGNVIGTCPEQGKTPYDVFVDYISVVSADSGKTGLDNSRAYVVDVGTKTEQKLIDDIGAALGLTKEEVEAAFTDNEVETVWNAADSTLPGGAAHEHTPADPVRENEIAATCTKEGSYDEVVYCSECKEELSSTHKTIAKIAHTKGTAVRENEVAATCSKEGSYDEVVYCTVCKEKLSTTHKTIAKIAHTKGAAVRENEKPATCTAEGSYDEVVYCTVCKEKLSTTHKTIAKIAHATVFVPEVPATYEKDGCKAHYKCTSCGKLFTDATGNVETTEANLRIPKLTPTEPEPTEPPVGKVLRGDIDGDGDVTIVDVVVIQRIDVGIITADATMKAAGDVNSDGDVNIIDATLVQRYLVGLNDNGIGKAL